LLTTEKRKEKEFIYLDYAATTPVREEVLKAMLPFLSQKFGNPSSLHTLGREAKRALEEARNEMASLIQSFPEEIVFTGGATEANNQALKAVAFARREKGRHIITSAIEHKSVLESARFLEKQGFEVTYLPVDKEGFVQPEDLKRSLRKETILVSIMLANNEIGTIEPIEELVKVVKENSSAYFHTDAVQAVSYLDLSVKDLKVDFLSASAHKFYGPKGVGFLYTRKGASLNPLLHGGEQEGGKRAGTQNVAGIVGMAKALKLARKEREIEATRLTQLRDHLISEVLNRFPEVILLGSKESRLPNNASFCFYGLEAEAILTYLDLAGIAASSGSACSSASSEPSHVLKALGLPSKWSRGAIRFSLGRYTSGSHLDYLLEKLEGILNHLRKISPFKKSEKKS